MSRHNKVKMYYKRPFIQFMPFVRTVANINKTGRKGLKKLAIYVYYYVIFTILKSLILPYEWRIILHFAKFYILILIKHIYKHYNIVTDIQIVIHCETFSTFLLCSTKITFNAYLVCILNLNTHFVCSCVVTWQM